MTYPLKRESHLSINKNIKIYFAEYGDHDGVPILFLHGGPGSKSKPEYLDILPQNLPLRIILFDQRGCGQSQPAGEIKHNTTQDLIQDIEKLRQHLKINNWYITGASWGSTLALLYAQAYPDKVRGLILRSIFLARRQDNEWLYSPRGVVRFFPDKSQPLRLYFQKHHLAWKKLINHAYKIILSGNINQQKEITSLISAWEYNLMFLDVPHHRLTTTDIDEEKINSTKIYLHYANHDFFLEENQILANIQNIKDIPTLIIHGRYDMVCPPEQAYLLHQNLNNSQLFFTNFAGHHLTWDGFVWLKHLIKEMIKTLS